MKMLSKNLRVERVNIYVYIYVYVYYMYVCIIYIYNIYIGGLMEYIFQKVAAYDLK